MKTSIDFSALARALADCIHAGMEITISQRHTAPAATVEIIEKKNTSRWWSRYNFEKNIMKMCLFALQERYPCEVSFSQTAFARKLATMMGWKPATASKHITHAARLGIINRAVVGNAYHVTGVNDDNAAAMRRQAAVSEHEPEEMPIPFSSFYHEEGKPVLEREIDNAVDESILP